MLLNFCFKVTDYVKEALVEASIGGDGFLDGDVGDVEAYEYCNAAPLVLVHHVDGMEAIALAEQAVEGRRNATALGVAKVDGASLETCLLLDQICKGFADAGEARVAERVYFRGADDLADFRQMAAFSDNDDAVMLAMIVVVLEQRADMVDINSCSGTRTTWAPPAIPEA